MSGELEITVSKERPAVGFRRFAAAPPELLFAAWTEPDQLRHWWGPQGYELVLCEAELRVGGDYRLVQRAPDGQEFGFSGCYLEFDRPRGLSRTFAYDGAPAEVAIETVTFEATGAGTTVHGESVFPSFAARDLYTRAGAERGMRESHRRLDAWIDANQDRQIGANDEQAR